MVDQKTPNPIGKEEEEIEKTAGSVSSVSAPPTSKNFLSFRISYLDFYIDEPCLAHKVFCSTYQSTRHSFQEEK